MRSASPDAASTVGQIEASPTGPKPKPMVASMPFLFMGHATEQRLLARLHRTRAPAWTGDGAGRRAAGGVDDATSRDGRYRNRYRYRRLGGARRPSAQGEGTAQ